MTEQDKVTVDDIIGIVKTEEQTNSVEEVRKLRGRENKTAKRFMIDDCSTLIDMHTRDTFDYVSDVCDLLNEQHETIQRLKQNIDELLSVNVEEELLKENEQLKLLIKKVLETTPIEHSLALDLKNSIREFYE